MVHFSDAPASAGRSRTARGRRTAARFVDAALALVAEHGLDNLTIQRLAKETGLAVGALYRHFPGKGALVATMQARVFADLADDLRAADAALPGPDQGNTAENPATLALARVIAALRAYRALAAHHPERFALLAQTLGDPRELVTLDEAQPVAAPLGRLMADMSRRLEDTATATALAAGDPRHRALVLWASVHGVLQLRKLERFHMAGMHAAALAEEATRTLLLGWGADPERLRRAEALARGAVPLPSPHDTEER
ncbi:MAG: TetR/AcrR family transcriptional regulator [Myxococcota bacterium]